jgi:hypothetical protein
MKLVKGKNLTLHQQNARWIANISSDDREKAALSPRFPQIYS